MRVRLALVFAASVCSGYDASDDATPAQLAPTGQKETPRFAAAPRAFARREKDRPTSLAEVGRDGARLPRVWCGGHYAMDCMECSATMGVDWCNGDCAWSERYDECVLRADMMWCGSHASISCEECVWEGDIFRGKSWCNGECYWLESNGLPGQCHAKYPNPPPLPDELPMPSAEQLSSRRQSFLTGTAKANSSTIQVWSSVPFRVGDEIWIGKPPWVDSRRIVAIKAPVAANLSSDSYLGWNDNATITLESPTKRRHYKWTTVSVHSTLVLHKIIRKKKTKNFVPVEDNHSAPVTHVIYTKVLDSNLSNCPRAKDLLIDETQILASALYNAMATFLGLGGACAVLGIALGSQFAETPEERDDRIQEEYADVQSGDLAMREFEVPSNPEKQLHRIFWDPNATEAELAQEAAALEEFMAEEAALAADMEAFEAELEK
eukprot:TRINITY_DN39318_c0_g1_i1.p1 TRINITY_DN39318_c0_g1~~TRINITY_DN39318_c0_g1_i1.p1  ORF type:complete len:436 (-),score=100.31 TRINITY_DN39318_c0_g1_i1:49-1356(-)